MQALAKMNQNPRKTVKDTLMNLKSDSARRVIDALVQEQNAKLSESDSTSEWIIAGLDMQKEIVKQWPSQKSVIKSIEVILKTEPAPFAQDFDDDDRFEDGGAHLQQAHRNVHQHGPAMVHNEPQVVRPPPPMGNQPMPMPMHGHEREPTPARQELPFPPHHGQGGHMQGQLGHHHGQGGHVHGQGGHHHGQQPHGLAPGPQHPGGGQQAAVIPPPPPHGGQGIPIKHTQVVAPPFDPQQPRAMPGGFPEPVPQFIPPEIVLDPRVLKHQKSKSKSLRQEFQEVYEPESESDISGSDGSHFSSRSVEDGAYGFIERSRSRGRNKSKTRSRGRSAIRSRSNGRDRMPKVYKVKKSHGRSRSDIEVVHEDKHSPPSKNSSPRSSGSAVPTQQIFNIHIDNDNDRERERKKDRGREVHAADYDSRRNSNPMVPPAFSNPMYTKRDKFDTHPMSRHSSVGGSDTGSSVIDGNSSIYTSDDSVFSEPPRPRMHSRTTSEVGGGLHLRSRNMPITRNEAFAPAYHEAQRRQKLRFEADDYPPHRGRGSLHEDYAEPHHSTSYGRPSIPARHHSVQMNNPFDPRYAGQPSRSYTGYPSQPYQQRYIAESGPDAFDFRMMADQLGAVEHMNHSRRSGLPHRRNSYRGRMAPEVDEWAYRPRVEAYSGYRHV
ncbi:uncharacterized protein N0V89_004630 [Didymosphaeria variabile]|uniref:Uncharacterized protein n=1 Tax=Didymosphaeria variabile TaxID=1932322 RepID=A0A9W8XPS7_9PLEO|nr:uncharacterized protein N0V89_004630 [Didymosphaeria variabile]KAJ4356595.1 hypothetical protein N0V89_004630 [Didymosphaeria variabile]